MPPPDWVVQVEEREGAPFLLYKGVLVGRLYGGCPIDEMLRKLNAPEAEGCEYGCTSKIANSFCPMHSDSQNESSLEP